MTDTAQIQSRQADYWNGEGAARWLANHARRRDPARATFVTRALQAAAVQAGETVLEIGCGAGEVAVELAELIGPTGALLAVDVSEPILAQATDKLAGYPNARTLIADASSYRFEPGSADLVFSTFGVMFFADPVAAFANIRTALKPQGRMAFVCWKAQMTGARDVVMKLIPRLADQLNDPGPLAFADKDRLDAILRAAGFSAIVFESLDSVRDVANGRGVDGAIETAVEAGPIARLLTDETPDARDTVIAALRDYFGSIEQDGAVIQPTAAWIVTATNG